MRPLLPFSREETRGYCEEHSFWFHDDPANSDLSFSRARIRHRVLDDLRLINPGVDSAIARCADLAREEDAFLNGMAAAALERTEIRLNGKLGFLTSDVEVAFDRSGLTSVPEVLFRRALRLAFGALGAAVAHDQVVAISLGMKEQKKGSVTADGGEVVVEWDEQTIGLRKLLPTTPFRYALTLPGETESEEFGWILRRSNPHPNRLQPRERASKRRSIPEKSRGRYTSERQAKAISCNPSASVVVVSLRIFCRKQV